MGHRPTRWIVAFLLIAGIPSAALSGSLVNDKHPYIVVWKSKDAYQGCVAEMEAIKKAGPICREGTATIVPSGTPARRVSGWIFLEVQILDGPRAGLTGFVPVEFYKSK